MPKHGIENHFVRPDRVYATSVWTPIVGYQPVSDAMQVAARFVQDRGLAGAGLIQRWRWRKQAQKNGFTGGLGFAPGNWLRDLIAGFKARIMAAKIQRQLAKRGGAMVSVDTSPRPTGAAQIVDAVRGLLPMPSVISPMQAANAVSNQGTVAAAAPTVLPQSAANVVAPGAHAMSVYLSNQWRQGN